MKWAALLLTPLIATAPAPVEQCSKPIPVPAPVLAAVPNSTYYTDVEPPKRFAHVPKGQLRVTFGNAGIDDLCGRPPCGMIYEGCTDGNRMALPDPFKMSDKDFGRIVRHEIGHKNGWAASHGD